MRLKRYIFLFIVLFCFNFKIDGQNVSLYNQFNGRFDFTFIGNTLNEFPNGSGFPCELLPSSDATLNLGPNDVIEKAYLYWAGSGTGDFDVKLNGIEITSQRNFSAIQTLNTNPPTLLPFFSAFADVTSILQTSGNGIYTLSDLDVSSFFTDERYCPNGTNFAGWAIVIIYGNPALQLNQLNVYDGLETLSSPNPPTAIDQLVINLGNLNVLDNSGAKVGFVAWEGDDYIQEQETLSINNHPLSDGLNPVNNAFNGTNNITGNSQLWNMDLDIYSIQNYITVGNTSATIKMTTAQDYVMINTIVTKLNSQLPDATVVLDSVEQQCDSRTITVNYTVSNLNSTDPLPSGTPIAFYINGNHVASATTTASIDIGGSMSMQLSLTVPDNVPLGFELSIVADDIGNQTGIVTELNETNNASIRTPVSLWVSPTLNPLDNLVSCNEGFTKGTFDFSSVEDLASTNPADTVQFYETDEDAQNSVNPILNPTNYVAAATPKEIFVRVSNEHCSAITSFLLTTRNCPPTVYNFISVNDDTYNNTFTIAGLRDIFLDFKIEIYNRWGRLLWSGDQNTEDWNGYVRDGFSIRKATDGTYFYLLFLNDADYPEPLKFKLETV